MHAGVASQRPGRGQVVAAEDRGDDPITVHLPDHGPVHEVDQAVSVHRDPWKSADTHTHSKKKVCLYLSVLSVFFPPAVEVFCEAGHMTCSGSKCSRSSS